jgi:endo-1,4-beta-xylanase
MQIPKRALLTSLAMPMVMGGASAPICANASGTSQGGFYTFWHDTGEGCMTLGKGGRYTVRWRLGRNGNLVAGRGWAAGSPHRIVRYTAHVFEPGANGYLALYGWSTDPLVEYYVVERWGAFTPPGGGATLLGTLDSDGGTYRVYRAHRIAQPSIAGTATFDQYWSVRTAPRAAGGSRVIMFGNHVAAWRKLGLTLGTLRYQVLATEGFGSDGRSDVTVADR